MNLENVQAYAAAQIAANSTLAAFGAAIVYSHFTADDAARAAINGALRATGVCIEIGLVSAQGDTTKPQNRYTLLDANFDVYVAENPKVSHSPAQMNLVALVAGAMQARAGATSPAIKCTSYDSALSENGYVLHVLTFTLPALL